MEGIFQQVTHIERLKKGYFACLLLPLANSIHPPLLVMVVIVLLVVVVVFVGGGDGGGG